MQQQTYQNKQLGNAGEEAVSQFLTKNGFIVQTKNFRTRAGEVDIIAEKKDTRVFVEVKTRKTIHFELSTVITRKKQLAIIKAALAFNQQTGWPSSKNSRFDVALVTKSGVDFSIKYIPNAFTITAEAFV